jgi:hypothetical protein
MPHQHIISRKPPDLVPGRIVATVDNKAVSALLI